jgi:NhaD family Na+/H+ antiporter
MMSFVRFMLAWWPLLIVLPVQATTNDAAATTLHLTGSGVGIAAVVLFVVAYSLVMAEEYTDLRKSKPVIIAAGVIWAMIGYVYAQHGLSAQAEHAVRHNLLEYAELMLFLLVAMTYINTMQELRVFDALRAWLVHRHLSFRQLFWITGLLAFIISPVADNLTTALLMCAVVMAVGGEDRRFVTLSCINIVVGANAGGAFSPFGDITTLMVWQAGKLDFAMFFALLIPSLVNFLVPAAVMHFAVPKLRPEAISGDVRMKTGALTVVVLFLLTIATAVSFHKYFGLPPVIGMLTGLGYLQLLGFYLQKRDHRRMSLAEGQLGDLVPFNIFNQVARAEWDTLLFFYGVVLCVGGLGFLGYLSMVSDFIYGNWSATAANTFIGLLSAVVDNIPVMFAVLTMNPDMSTGQWLLVTLTAGVGGSLLSIGSAAGVALMGQARGVYSFFGHLKWSPAVMAGYLASIGCHLWLNAAYF